MPGDLVKRLVIEHGQQSGLGRFSVGLCHSQCPLLFLSRGEPVAEGFPRDVQFLVGQCAPDGSRTGIAHSVFHPSIGEEYAVTVFRFIGEATRVDGITLADDALFQHLLAGENGVDDVLVFGR